MQWSIKIMLIPLGSSLKSAQIQSKSTLLGTKEL